MKMTLSNTIFEEQLPETSNIQNGSTNLDSLYCSHLWSNSCLRNAIITASHKESQMIKYCYTCKGKIRKYDLSSVNKFIPKTHSTPNRMSTSKHIEPNSYEMQECSLGSFNHVNDGPVEVDIDNNVESKEYIPSISRKLDSSFRHTFVSQELQLNQSNPQRLRKSPKGLGCIVNFSLTESPMKKHKQIQACSISVMIIAIIVISLILVNFTTPNFIHANNASSTIVVPTKNLTNKTSSSAITSIYSDLPPTSLVTTNLELETTTEYVSTLSTENVTEKISSVLSKIRKNIRTYSRYRNHSSPKPKDIINRDISQRFCSCQRNEICMLDESSGTSLCRIPIDDDDPTGCGGLCALETEACQLVDKARGVRVCRLLSMVTCGMDEWRCRNGLCVPAEARCDGAVQCYDRSDEMHCECDLSKQFRCGHSISCFPNSKLCDGVIDCWDGYDEVNCTTECPKEQFTCTDGQCILSSRFCDGYADCGDGSDEPDGCYGECGAHEIRCKNQRCIPRGALCDGHDHCGDATDELQCSDSKS